MLWNIFSPRVFREMGGTGSDAWMGYYNKTNPTRLGSIITKMVMNIFYYREKVFTCPYSRP